MPTAEEIEEQVHAWTLWHIKNPEPSETVAFQLAVGELVWRSWHAEDESPDTHVGRWPNGKRTMEDQWLEEFEDHALCSCRKSGVGFCDVHRNRHRIGRKDVGPLPDEDVLDDAIGPEETPDEARSSAMLDQLDRAMEELTPRQREAIFRVFWMRQTVREAAADLGCSPANLDQHVQLGKKKLRRLIESVGIPDTGA